MRLPPPGAGREPTGRFARGLLLGLSTGTALVLIAFVAVFALARVAPATAVLKPYVDIGAEGNLPTWWNTSLLTLVAAGALAARWSCGEQRERRAWTVVAAAGLYLSLDEATMLHERLNPLVRATGIDVPTYAWVLPGGLLGLLGAAVLTVVGRALPRPARPALLAALAVYLVAALGLETLTGAISRDGHSWVFTLGILAEEALEMTAAALAAAAVAPFALRIAGTETLCGAITRSSGTSLIRRREAGHPARGTAVRATSTR